MNNNYDTIYKINYTFEQHQQVIKALNISRETSIYNNNTYCLSVCPRILFLVHYDVKHRTLKGRPNGRTNSILN